MAAAEERMAPEEFDDVHQSPGIWSPEKFQCLSQTQARFDEQSTCPNTV